MTATRMRASLLDMDRREQEGYPPTLVVKNRVGARMLVATTNFSRRNPADREDVVSLAPEADRELVRDACLAAQQALAEWARIPAPARSEVLQRVASLLAERRESLARFVTRETGQCLRESRASVLQALATLEFFVGEGRRLHGQTLPSERRDQEQYTYRRPLGVVGVVTTGLHPVSLPIGNLAPALLCGNTVVWKPSEDAPGVAELVADLFARGGLPPGVLNVVHGTANAGEHLAKQVAEGLVDQMDFTGSTAVGRDIGAICGRGLQRPALALGAKNPLVILADADIELSVEGVLRSAFGNAGQDCTSTGNVIVDQRVSSTIQEQLVTRAMALRIGDPSDERTAYGPLTSERFMQLWIEQRAVGMDDGAHLVLDGRRITQADAPPGFCGDATRGLYGSPRIWSHVRMTMRIAQDECLGPTVNIVEVDGLEEALATANMTPYGLCATLYTRDAKAMHRFREEVRAGVVSINQAPSGQESHLPFGGNGASGNGSRTGGMWSLDTYTRWQTVRLDVSAHLPKAVTLAPPPPAPEKRTEWDDLVSPPEPRTLEPAG